jgi:hypothetical protein
VTGNLLGALAAALGVSAFVGGAVAQTHPPTSHREAVVIGSTSMYEGRYGTPQLLDLDEEPRPWPRQQSIRTVGLFSQLQGGVVGGAGRRMEWLNPLSTHAVCGRLHCLALVPAEEMAEVFSTIGRSWVGQPVEIVGAIDDLNKDPRSDPLWSFLVWSITPQQGGSSRAGESATTSELEALVTSPRAQAGERITVKGVFRGANLFNDMPPGSQRQPGDWVLRDGPFFIWVTGKRPRGSGFDLDPSSRSDCRWRLEVTGEVESEAGLIYLKAKDIRLLGLAPDSLREQ